MLLKRTNIEEKLQRTRLKQSTSNSILNDVEAIFNQVDENHKVLSKRVLGADDSTTNDFNFDELETNKIYHVNQIKEVCIDYRLRFLDTKYFKGKLPQEALAKIKHLEEVHNTTIAGYKIVAPSKLFKLENADDPLLFAPMGNGYYYLIHKWGNDLNPLRKWLMMPFKNFENLVFTTLLVSFLATFLVPDGLFSNGMTPSQFWMIFFFMFKSIGAIVIYYGFAAGKNFNTAIWDSKYFNA